MSSALTAGSEVYTKGFCTHAFLLRGKSLDKLADLLGYTHHRLAAGATTLFLQRVPGPDDLQLSGYTHFSEGAVQGNKRAPAGRDPYRMEEILKADHGWSDAQIRAYKHKMIGSKIVTWGPERLAKLLPFAYSRSDDFPPGEGVFQVKVIRELPFLVKANILPGQMWSGDYS